MHSFMHIIIEYDGHFMTNLCFVLIDHSSEFYRFNKFLGFFYLSANREKVPNVIWSNGVSFITEFDSNPLSSSLTYNAGDDGDPSAPKEFLTKRISL